MDIRGDCHTRFTYLCLLATVVTTVHGITSIGENSDTVLMARCRVNCLKQFPSPSLESHHEQCQSRDCAECWKVCHLLFHAYLVWGEMCKRKLFCKPGCQAACHFKRNHKLASTRVGKWEMSEVSRDSDAEYTWMEWDPPRQTLPSVPPVQSKFVYIIFEKNGAHPERDDWKLLEQTSRTSAEYPSSQLVAKPVFWLLVIGENGTIAEKTFTVDDGSLSGGILSSNMVQPDDLNITVSVASVKGNVHASISWQNLQVPENKTIIYLLSWFLVTCNIYAVGPYCGLPSDYFMETVYGQGGSPTKPLYGLTYNSEFLVTLEAKDGDIQWYGKKTFYTPLCYEPNLSFTKCLRENHTFESSDPNTTVSPDDLLWQLNVSESIPSKSDDNVVTVNLSWAPVFNHSGVQYNVSWMEETAVMHVGTRTTNVTFMSLELEPDQIYRVVIVATYGSSDGHWVILGERLLTLNTHVEPQLEPSVSVNKNVKPTSRALDGVIIGVTCAMTAIIVSIIVFVLYKKRKTVKDVIITKTAVTKSNSYKSSVGYKADYANELLVVADEWELEPGQLTFSSTPLGQGAFGKVVTGYCEERRVAIKVLKDCAPLSYKEDLLAEISLMKKLGTHPNIVSMIGACTLHEPIALVMEYVPYGNLQSFLRKCRQEGEIRKNGRRRELTYSMVDAHGCIENGVINAADILSFARQIVMAMEYLAEKKYVHRDLAARNVLLDRNKVVKVCDFGLSRDIYNDNQYKKLTSGKLPIKWMAIESLRDRVFTTQSDVWSFGILLWESVTMGASPYPNIALADLFYMLSNGYRMEKPSNCSDELYNIMRMTWKESPKERPNFTQLRLHIEDLLTRDCNYLELENIDVPLNNAESSSLPLSDPFSTSAMASAARAEARQDRLPSDELTVDVCVHDRSTEKLLMNQSDDCEREKDYRSFRQKQNDAR